MLAIATFALAAPVLGGLRHATAEPADDIKRLALGLLAAFALSALGIAGGWPMSRAQRRAAAPLGGFAAWLLFTGLLSEWPLGSLAAAWPTLAGIGLAALVIALPLRPRDAGTWALCLAVAATLACLWALGPGTGGDARAALASRFAFSSTFGNPESFAGYLAAVLSVTVSWMLTTGTGGWRIAAAVPAALWLALLLGTASRGPALALAVSVLAVTTAVRPPWLFSRGALLSAAVVFAALAAVHVALGPRSPAASLAGRLGETFDPAAVSTQQRLATWRVAADLARDRPLTGHGWGQFEFLFQPRLAERLIGDAGGPWAGAARALGGRVPHHAHSDYLEITVGTGGVGLGLFVWLVVDSLRSGWRGTRRGEPGWRGVKAASLAGLVCLGALAAVSFPLHRPVHLAIFWICVGLCRRP